MNIEYKLTSLFGVFCGSILLINSAFDLMMQPNTFKVIGGMLLIGVILLGDVAILREIFKRKNEKEKETNES